MLALAIDRLAHLSKEPILKAGGGRQLIKLGAPMVRKALHGRSGKRLYVLHDLRRRFAAICPARATVASACCS